LQRKNGAEEKTIFRDIVKERKNQNCFRQNAVSDKKYLKIVEAKFEVDKQDSRKITNKKS
jgi:hypothetical protein